MLLEGLFIRKHFVAVVADVQLRVFLVRPEMSFVRFQRLEYLEAGHALICLRVGYIGSTGDDGGICRGSG